ncbi:MAG: anhydro-N-acetylmuramic acid kinase [Legionellaceae bacterium]|nr:anhydro-N-acetylmuramic acid kinase [Legionellaceae bacterium]
MNLFIGLMSGTSMDGIDAVLVDLKQNQLIVGITHPYTTHLQEQLCAFDASQKHSVQSIQQLNHQLGHAFSEAVLTLLKKTQYTPDDIIAIGSHGQTLYHDPGADIPTTLQLGCPHTIAAKTGMTVVADFRTRDLVLGGQGAPLAPYYHHILFKSKKLPLAVVNIGGISNLSVLRPSKAPLGYDTGPGNVLMDAWIKKHKNLPYDKNGDWAASGQMIPACLNALLDDTFFKKTVPKSIDKAYYSLSWIQKFFTPKHKPEDVQATLLHLTAYSIADAIKISAPECKQVLLCGGGAHNHVLTQVIKTYLPGYQVNTTELFDVSPDYLEAMMFAWFAQQTLQHQALDLTQITGASKPAILGAVYL